MIKRGTLLGIFAHPDDESFGPGGTLALYALKGFDVHVCTMTDGAAGTADPDCWNCLDGYQDLADRRHEELGCAVDILGGTLHYMGYRDSGMAGNESNQHPDAFINQPLEQVAERLARLIRRLRPDIVLTHDETGGYFHPDHIYTYQAVMQAVDLAAGPDAELEGEPWQVKALYCHVIPQSMIRWMVRLWRLSGQDPTHFGRNQDIDMTKVGKPGNRIHIVINVRDVENVKLAASVCHGSQGGGSGLNRQPKDGNLKERAMALLRQRFTNREHFEQIYPPPSGRRSQF